MLEYGSPAPAAGAAALAGTGVPTALLEQATRSVFAAQTHVQACAASTTLDTHHTGAAAAKQGDKAQAHAAGVDLGASAGACMNCDSVSVEPEPAGWHSLCCFKSSATCTCVEAGAGAVVDAEPAAGVEAAAVEEVSAGLGLA